MQADHAIEMGATHEVCQDYALSGQINEHIAFAIVSDGCSASQDVDIGARLLCFAAKRFLLARLKDETSIDSVINNVETFECDMWTVVLKDATDILCKIDIDLYNKMMALDCTLLVVVSDENNTATFGQGDGGFIIQGPEFASFRHIEFKSGAPYYLSYEINQVRHMGYMGQFGYEPVVVWNDQIKDGDVLRNIEMRFDRVDAEKLSKHTAMVHENPLRVTVVSDGINSFQTKVSKKDWKNLTFEYILPKLVKYKNFNGEFVHRRLNGFTRYMNQEHGEWRHYDDLAIASIHIRRI